MDPRHRAHGFPSGSNIAARPGRFDAELPQQPSELRSKATNRSAASSRRLVWPGGFVGSRARNTCRPLVGATAYMPVPGARIRHCTASPRPEELQRIFLPLATADAARTTNA